MTIDKFGRTSGSTSTTSTTRVTKTYVHETFLEDNPIENDTDFQNTYTCINVKDPVNDQDTATKSYVDKAVSNPTTKKYIEILAKKNGDLTVGAVISVLVMEPEIFLLDVRWNVQKEC